MNTKLDLCDLCGGELNHSKIDYELKVKNEIILIHNVEADVCHQCGETYLDASTSEIIDEIYLTRKKTKPLRYIPVPVYQFSKRKLTNLPLVLKAH